MTDADGVFDPFAFPLGHNAPRDPNEMLRADLCEKYAGLLKRRDDLLAGIERAPDIIDNDETAGLMGDFAVKQIAVCITAAETYRVSEKEPFLSGGRTVDGFFQTIMAPLTNGKKTIDARRKRYLDRKVEIERAARVEAERLARAEVERAAREAAAAEAALKNETDLAKAIAADEAAAAARAAAEKAARDAAAKPADLSRVRGDYGSVSSLKQFWNFAEINRSVIDLDALRDHLPLTAIEQAVRSWIAANKDALKAGAKLRGVRIYEDTRL